MKKLRNISRMLSAVLSISFLIGLLPSIGISANPMVLCEQWMEMGTMSSGMMNHGSMLHDDCPTHGPLSTDSDCAVFTDCCIIKASTPATVPVSSSVKINPANTLLEIISIHEDISLVSEKPTLIRLSNSYSPPLIFLANSTFII